MAMKLPVKMHLENPFLGSNCYVGSSSSPLIWNLTTGTTAPPAPTHQSKAASATSNSSKKARSPKSKKPPWSTTPGRHPVPPAAEGSRLNSSSTRSSTPRPAFLPLRAKTPPSSKTKFASPPLQGCAKTTRKTRNQGHRWIRGIGTRVPMPRSAAAQGACGDMWYESKCF